MQNTKSLILFLTLLVLPLLNGCLMTVRNSPRVVALEDSAPASSPGPPAHAKAHGYRNKYNYYYYPTSNVYLDTDRDVYFYLDSRGAWEMSVSLPQSLYVSLGDHVTIAMNTDQPYRENHEHKTKYPPGIKKKKKKK